MRAGLQIVRTNVARLTTEFQRVAAKHDRRDVRQIIIILQLEEQRIGRGAELFEVREVEIRHADLVAAVRHTEDSQVEVVVLPGSRDGALRVLIEPADVEIVGSAGAEQVDPVHHRLPAGVPRISRSKRAGQRAAHFGSEGRRLIGLASPFRPAHADLVLFREVVVDLDIVFGRDVGSGAEGAEVREILIHQRSRVQRLHFE